MSGQPPNAIQQVAKPLSGMDKPILRFLATYRDGLWVDGHTITRHFDGAPMGSRLNSLRKRGLIVKSSEAKGYWAITRHGEETLRHA